MMSQQSDGRCYEDFEVGQIIRHSVGRTISTADNTWFTLLTNNNNQIHFDHHYAAQTEFGQPLVNSTLTLAIIVGLTVADVSKNGVNLGWNEITIPAPVFEGDTLYAHTEILSMRQSKSRPNMGLVEIKTIGFKHDGTVIMTYKRTILIYKRGHVPRYPTPTLTTSP
jgi:itaconyl-CoA hydratase